MAGRERKYAPRVRTTRPVGVGRTQNEPPSQSLPAPSAHGSAWYLPAPLSQRLHEKSAIGRPVSDGGVVMTVEEVMYCHWYRHVPLPSPDWFEQQVDTDTMVASRTIAMDVLRNGGERVVPVSHLTDRFESLPSSTWAVRWERHEAWTQHPGYSQVRLQRTHDQLNWNELSTWVSNVNAMGHVAELCVIDDEFDATIYHLTTCLPTGDQMRMNSLDDESRTRLMHLVKNAVPMDGGYFVRMTEEWPLPSFGVEHFSGRFLRQEERDYLLSGGQHTDDDLFGVLVDAGLLLRPGFKYGCRWRAYETSIAVEHAPWLIQPLKEAPSTWDDVCLSVRLAEGVNKRWLCALPEDTGFTYLNIQRRD